MSFLTSFIFFFSTGWGVESEADLVFATGRLTSARAFGVLVGVLFVRGLAILASFLSSLSHPFALPRLVSLCADHAPGSSDICGANARDNHRPFWRIRYPRDSPLPTPTRRSRPRAPSARLASNGKGLCFRVLATGR